MKDNKKNESKTEITSLNIQALLEESENRPKVKVHSEQLTLDI